MKVVLDWIKGKLSGFAIVVLATMLILSTLERDKLQSELIPLRTNYASELARVDRVTKENENLRTQLETRPTQYITVQKDICTKQINGAVAEERIKLAPTTKKQESADEKAYADIDAPFDPEFLRLLE